MRGDLGCTGALGRHLALKCGDGGVTGGPQGFTGSEQGVTDQGAVGLGLLFTYTLGREEAFEVVKLGMSVDSAPAHVMPGLIKSSIARAVNKLVGGTKFRTLKDDEEIACCFKNLFMLHSVAGANPDLSNDLTTVLIGRLYGELLSIRTVPRAWVRLLHTLIKEPWQFLHYSAFSDISRVARGGATWEALLTSLATELESCANERYIDSLQPAPHKGTDIRLPSGVGPKEAPQYLYVKPVGALCTRMVKLLAADKEGAGQDMLPQFSIIGMLLRMTAGASTLGPSRPGSGLSVRKSDLAEYHENKPQLSTKQNNALAGSRCRALLYAANEIEKRWFLMSSYSPRMTSDISAALAYEAVCRKGAEEREKSESENAAREQALALAAEAEEALLKEKAKFSILTGPLRDHLRDLCAGRKTKDTPWGSTDKGERYDAIFGAFLRRSMRSSKELLVGNTQLRDRTVRALLKYPSLYPAVLMAEPDSGRYSAVTDSSVTALRDAYTARPMTKKMVAKAAPEIRSLTEAVGPHMEELPVEVVVTVLGVSYQPRIESDPLGVWVMAGLTGLRSFDTGAKFGTLGCASKRMEDILLFISALKTLRNRGLLRFDLCANIHFDSRNLTPYSWTSLLTALGTVSARMGDDRNKLSFSQEGYKGLSYSELSTMSGRQLDRLQKGMSVRPLQHFQQKVVELRDTPIAFESAEYLAPLLTLLGRVVQTGGSCVDSRPSVFRSVALERLGLPPNVVSVMMSSGTDIEEPLGTLDVLPDPVYVVTHDPRGLVQLGAPQCD